MKRASSLGSEMESLTGAEMELSIEDELQATVETLRRTQEENIEHQRQLIHTHEQLLGKHRQLERCNNCIHIYNQQIQGLQHELQMKNEELDEIKARLQNQREALTNYQHYFAVLRNNRWRLLAALVNTRMMIALGLERVRQLESHSGDPTCTRCRESEAAAAVPRVPTPALSRPTASPPRSPQEAVDDDDCSSEISDKLELQSRVSFLENQLIELGEKRQQERLEINDVLQTLEEEVRLLRDDDSRHELVEHRLVESLHLLRSLMDLNMSRRTIGNLVVEAVESCVSPSTQELSPLRFLNHLHRSILEYERCSTQGLIRLALQAV